MIQPRYKITNHYINPLVQKKNICLISYIFGTLRTLREVFFLATTYTIGVSYDIFAKCAAYDKRLCVYEKKMYFMQQDIDPIYIKFVSALFMMRICDNVHIVYYMVLLTRYKFIHICMVCIVDKINIVTVLQKLPIRT